MKETSLHTRQGIRDLPEILNHLGVEKAVICPGSRNAPLILSFVKYSNIECLSITDERSAAYFALGMAQYSEKPVALVVTSGTAVLNCAPAIAEAYYQKIPLIVVTADRPKEWIDQADGQTIRQHNIFANYIKAAYELPLDTNIDDTLWYSNRTVCEAVHAATSLPKGPVHLNIPLREPLYTALPENASGKWLSVQQQTQTLLLPSEIEKLKTEWHQYHKKMIVVGSHAPHQHFRKSLEAIALRNDTIVIAENLSNNIASNILLTPESFIASLSEENKHRLQPDLLISIGDTVVSKRLKNYLRAYKPSKHWHINPDNTAPDTFMSITHILSVAADHVLSAMADEGCTESDYARTAADCTTKMAETTRQFSEGLAYSDFMIFQKLMQRIPSEAVVHFSNSTSVRYSQLFPCRADAAYFCNRGTSGIDGCVSTAAGAAYVAQKTTLLITGDLSFIYDSNGLWNNNIDNNFKIIVINNKGGNIFRLIDSGEAKEGVNNFFETPQHVDLEKLATSFGFQYFRNSEMQHIETDVDALLSYPHRAVLEFVTDMQVNSEVFKNYYKYLSQK